MGRTFTFADVVTVAGYGLGLWWATGGPGWAALASLAADELDGPLRRVEGGNGFGDALDLGADVALTPLALVRLSRDTGQPAIAAVGAPVALALQAKAREKRYKPPVGSLRAAIMLGALLVEERRRRLGLPSRANPAASPRRPRKGRR